MMGLTEDRPIFMQIKEYIEGEILTERLKPHDQIPSTNQLVAFFSVNPVTVLKGVGLLTDEGILFKKRGVGMFVMDGAAEIIKKRYRDAFSLEYLLPLVQRGKNLGLTYEELQKLIEKVWEEE